MEIGKIPQIQRDLGVCRAEGCLVDCQHPLEQWHCFVVATLNPVEDCQGVQRPAGLGVVPSKQLLLQGKCPTERRLGVFRATKSLVDPCKVVRHSDHRRMLEPVRFLRDGKGTLEYRLGLLEATLDIVERSQAVEGLSDDLMLFADDRLPDRHRTQKSPFRLVAAVRLPIQERQVGQRLGKPRIPFAELLRLGKRQLGPRYRLGMIALTVGGEAGIAVALPIGLVTRCLGQTPGTNDHQQDAHTEHPDPDGFVVANVSGGRKRVKP